MKKTIFTAAILSTLALSAPAQAGGVAVCIQIESGSEGNTYDSEYFTRSGPQPSVDGYYAERVARKDYFKSYPNGDPVCMHNGSKFTDGGYFVLIKSGRKKDSSGRHLNRWALGYGKDRAAALTSAKNELSRRDRFWKERTHGYSISLEDEM